MRLVIKGAENAGAAGGGNVARWSVEVPLDTPLVIGRDKRCDLPLDDTNISRHHVVCHAQGGRLHIRDLGSRNGTYLNGAKVVDAVMLAGDEITLGKYRIRLEAEEGDPVPPTMVGATFTTSGTEPGMAAVAGLGAAGDDSTPESPSRWEIGPIAAVVVTVCLLAGIAAVVPLAMLGRDSETAQPPAPPGTPAAIWNAARTGDRTGAERMLTGATGPAAEALSDWLRVGGGLPVERPGASQEIPPLERLTQLPATALDPIVRTGAHGRLARVRTEQRASRVARRAIDHEAAGDVEAAIAAFEELGAWPETGAAKRHYGRAATLRARRCTHFRELGASNRAAGDWDGALRCFRAAARHARGAQLDLVAPELREAEREVAALAALAEARGLAARGEWPRAVEALDAAPAATSQQRRLDAVRSELQRRIALRDAWRAYTEGDSRHARTLLDRWRLAGDPEATALWRRAGATRTAFEAAEAALAAQQYEEARAGWESVLRMEPDDRVSWRRRAEARLAEWPVERVVAELRGAGLAAIEREQFRAGRDLLERARLLDETAVAADLDRLRTRAQLLYNTALNLQRTDPSGARALYALVIQLTRPGEPKHASAKAALARLGR